MILSSAQSEQHHTTISHDVSKTIDDASTSGVETRGPTSQSGPRTDSILSEWLQHVPQGSVGLNSSTLTTNKPLVYEDQLPGFISIAQQLLTA